MKLSLIKWAMPLLLCLAPLGACAGLGAPFGGAGSGSATGGPVAAVGDAVVIEGGRALIIANLVYQSVGTAAAIGIERGIITGDTKVKVKAASARIVDALDKGERAVLAGDKAVSAAQALDGLDDLCALHPTLAAACAAVR